jgi:hypothetical protein
MFSQEVVVPDDCFVIMTETTGALRNLLYVACWRQRRTRS